MYIPSFLKIDWYLLKLSSGNKNMDVSKVDNCKKLINLLISNPKPVPHNIYAWTKFRENPLIFTEVIVWKQKYGHVVGI